MAASFALLASACTAVDDGRTDGEVEALRLGRVHVVLETGDDAGHDDFEVSARFAYVRGLDEDFARARIDMPVLAHEILQAPECTATEHLTAPEGEADGGEIQELLLVDAGDLRVQVGESRYDVPLTLVPDLLPYMSGVEYIMYSDELPAMPVDAVNMSVAASGSQTDELPPFVADGQVPGVLDLESSFGRYRGSLRGELVLGWSASEPADEPITLRITGLVGDEPSGSEVTCVAADVGQARLSLQYLQGFGLTPNAEGLRVEASRMTTHTFDAGDFAGSEFIVERRETTLLP